MVQFRLYVKGERISIHGFSQLEGKGWKYVVHRGIKALLLLSTSKPDEVIILLITSEIR